LTGDLDNYLKAIKDGLNGVAYHDDRQVKQLEGWLLAGRGALCRIEVTRLEEGWAQGVEIPDPTR
ncbi:RusA family crossover junction endodeoxyribonuclease, partial [Streptococcus mitis]|uniref:RusA family crossover junction endodeoxyribonuclease n=1 Tax=Streptococcus mitis TaxID=28037 RepID=UPI0021B763DB